MKEKARAEKRMEKRTRDTIREKREGSGGRGDGLKDAAAAGRGTGGEEKKH